MSGNFYINQAFSQHFPLNHGNLVLEVHEPANDGQTAVMPFTSLLSSVTKMDKVVARLWTV